jgi:Zn-dependent peptidase ImmA (M78 family)/DNA-binding XRE family transcriptional regulator
MMEAFITPDLVRWARERADASIQETARRVHTTSDRLQRWEQGTARPTFRQAQALAHALSVPFGFLFLSAPPPEELPLPDLRTVSGQPVTHPSPELSDVANDLLRKQQWYREFRESERAEPLPFVGRYSLTDAVDNVGAALREVFRLDNTMRAEAKSWEQFLRLFVVQVEDVGVLVFRSGVVENNTHRPLDVQEFRGLVISDPVAPVIFINSQDAKAAQIFTLAHELAHLAIGESGVSNPEPEHEPQAYANAVERFCNQAAAEMLLPRDEFERRWTDTRSVEENLDVVARTFRVSALAVLRRAHELGRITNAEFRGQIEILRGKPVDGGTPKGDGGDFYATFFTRNSRTFTAALLAAVAEQRVLHRDAARLLNVKVGTLPRIEQRLFGGM